MWSGLRLSCGLATWPIKMFYFDITSIHFSSKPKAVIYSRHSIHTVYTLVDFKQVIAASIHIKRRAAREKEF